MSKIDKHTWVCPYLGLNHDRTQRSGRPTAAHRCYVGGDQLAIPVDQTTYCLSAAHKQCPLYLEPRPTPSKSQPVGSSKIASAFTVILLILGIYATTNGFSLLREPATPASEADKRDVGADAPTAPDLAPTAASASPEAPTDTAGLLAPTTNSSATAPAPSTMMSFTLINAETNQPITGFDPLPDGATLDLTQLPSQRLNIRANITTDGIGSVQFVFNDTVIHTENTPPFSFPGDRNHGQDYLALTLPGAGLYTLTATAYPEPDGRGTANISASISFTVID
jgi:hypothetical protein